MAVITGSSVAAPVTIVHVHECGARERRSGPVLHPERFPWNLNIPLWFEIATYVGLALVLGFDIFWAYRRPHIPSTRESGIWIGFYVALALAFAGLLLWFDGPNTPGSSSPAG